MKVQSLSGCTFSGEILHLLYLCLAVLRAVWLILYRQEVSIPSPVSLSDTEDLNSNCSMWQDSELLATTAGTLPNDAAEVACDQWP